MTKTSSWFDGCTVIEVDTADCTGLLYDLATTITEMDIDVRGAKVSTLVDRAHDVFFVVNAGGVKIVDPVVQKKIEEALICSAVRAAAGNGARMESGQAKEGEP